MKRCHLLASCLAFIGFAASIAPAQPADIDWEDAMSKYHQLDETVKDNVRAAGLPPDKMAARQRWIVATYAGSGLAAQIEAAVPGRLLDEKKYDEVAPAAIAFINKYPRLSETHQVPIAQVLKLIFLQDVPEDVRIAALKTITPALKDRSLSGHKITNALKRMKISPLAKYELVKPLSEVIGNYPHTRAAQWDSLRAASSEMGGERYLEECRQFVKKYGKDSAQGRQAHQSLLQAVAATDPAAAKELETMQAEDAQWNATVVETFAQANKQLEAGDGEGAAATLDKGLANVPPFTAEAGWSAFLRGRFATESFSLPVYSILLDRAPNGEAIDLVFTFLRPMRFIPLGGEMMVKLAGRHQMDRERSLDIADAAIRAVEQSENPALQLQAQRNAAAAAKTLHAEDRAVHALLGLGKFGWDLAPEEAKAALREAAASYPAQAEASEAGWMLALLEGKLSVTQDLLPRARAAKEELPVRPEITQLPPPPADTGAVTTDDGVSKLVGQNIKADLLSKQIPAASDGSESAVFAVDENPATSWAPTKLPASLIIPLAKESTVNRLRIASNSSLFFTVSLLDRQGKTLARFERDWSFSDYYRRTAYWPDEDMKLGIPATPGACYVRLDVYLAAEGVAKVHSIEAYATPIAAKGTKLFDPTGIPANARSVKVNFAANEPLQTVSYDASGEWSRNYMTFRWGKFWVRLPRALKMTTVHNLAFSIWGDNAKIVVTKSGAIAWRYEENAPVVAKHPEEEEGSLPLEGKRDSGFHVLKLSNSSLGQGNDQGQVANCQFVRLEVDGKSRVRVAVRFGTKAGKWSGWLGPVAKSGDTVNVPADVDGSKPELVQIGAFFDAREVRGLSSATLKGVTVAPLTNPNQAAPTAYDPTDRLHFRENLKDVADLLQRRAAVVVYPKAGTAAEYEAAKRLADKANAYLISDDMGLNGFKGLPLAVGTPLRNRYTRQLLATQGLWNLPEFFAAEDGIVGLERGDDQQPWALFATGDTPEAVVRAADRLLAAIQPSAAPTSPVRLYDSNTLVNIFGWNTDNGQATATELPIRMGTNDRRSGQLGVIADKSVQKLHFAITQPVGDGGATLPLPVVRPVGFYEWIPFFGDVRIPNALLPTDTVSMPANTSRGVWVTAVTPADAKPGTYRAELTVDADGQKSVVPVVIRVEPVGLMTRTKTATYSFAYVPYWFHRGSPAYEAALRALARNEAMHGVTHVGPWLQFKWTKEPYTVPVKSVATESNLAPDAIKWNAFSEGDKKTPPANSLFMMFASPIQPREVFTVIDIPDQTEVSLAYWNGSEWVAIASKVCRTNKNASNAVPWEMGDLTVQYLRLTATKGEGFQTQRIGAFTDKSRKYPATLDFSGLDWQMKIYEEEYAKFGMVPSFIVQSNAYLSNLGGDMFGVNHWFYSGVARMVGPQLNEMLKQTNRADRVLFKASDEPGDMKFWTLIASDYHKAGLRTMTCHAILPNMQDAAGILNPWCPYYGHNVLLPFFRERQKAGDEFWWYTYGPPNMRLTGQPAENIIFYWLTGKWRIDGAMNYASMHASDFSMPVPFRYDAGQDHNLLFLPDATLLDTPRRELEGEGISDLKLIEYVRNGADRLAKQNAAAGKALNDELDKMLAEAIPYKFGYSVDPKHWLDARNKLYDLAVRAGAAR